jgi:GNAT superfamily N-acetyltransferase
MQRPPFIRKASENDIPRLIEIRSSVHENILSNPAIVTEDDYRWFIAEELLWVWDDNDIVRGFTAGDTRTGWIWALFVDPDSEGNGIAQALFPYACQSLKDAGHRTASLSTETGTRAEKFYMKAGWTKGEVNEKNEVLFTTRL